MAAIVIDRSPKALRERVEAAADQARAVAYAL
jgi:hypothetical protein